ncbi:hypothetical protein [Pseudomonas aeruginosa]|uniref:hypothetical protein n=1 Tax=Pseudomonas aeruginosa TaxID=287 RepID=UPI00201DC100|nr:hypothetical protein [Pseudomonas aeruginosa]MCM1999061.1 hypothetical protein [Pseudomonas aeruginosa]MCM2005565.1 hypothetical protein [Pseudomonas aeruginosa]MCM2011583.1 hypothetical protein [Pseudomonas aeruginosa]MCM2018740.1 hypothetical protein [Pseudomonas aeruginosa]MCM2025179.1 hypothetical protein [Pseudomonas aeruginosa]
MSNIKDLTAFPGILGPGPMQGELFHVERQIEIDGVEMGVLENGVPYLTESGLARMCGIDRKVLNRLAIGWQEEKLKERGKAINEMLEAANYFEPGLYLKSELNGSEINAYTEPVCMALLEYYAFVTKEPRAEAIRAFRRLARETFRVLVYKAVGYSPEQKVLESWRHFHDRVDMTATSVPFGYFSVFREIASMIVPMIRAGVMISDRVVPDISVGKAWSEHWTANNLEAVHGERQKYDHEYPLYYPQAKSNPQPSFAYPDSALGDFRAWLVKTYITSKFPTYLLGQTKKGTVLLGTANKALEAFSAPALPAPKKK